MGTARPERRRLITLPVARECRGNGRRTGDRPRTLVDLAQRDPCDGRVLLGDDAGCPTAGLRDAFAPLACDGAVRTAASNRRGFLSRLNAGAAPTRRRWRRVVRRFRRARAGQWTR